MFAAEEAPVDPLTEATGAFSDWVYTYVLIGLLLLVGLYFTIRTRGVQFREFRQMLRGIFGSRDSDGDGISSFQAFAIGLASRVGTGNIAGVALAIVAGGPGAVFWMWVVALVGMATAFVEATLAQLFKVRWKDGTFRGGPAFYIERGLGSRFWGAVFAVFLIFSFGVSYEMVQANTISETLANHANVSPWVTAILLALLTLPILFGGIRRIAKVTEVLAPIMAVVYIFIAILVILLNYDRILPVFQMIFESAFGLREAVAGTEGGIVAAMLNGTRRGLFSNEAGEGSAPNAASTAQVTHPAKQGFIQSIGVFVDTILVCSATAFIILNAAPSVYTPGVEIEMKGASLTIAALQSELGTWIVPVMLFLLFVFGYSSIIGNFAYTEVNVDFLSKGSPRSFLIVCAVTVASVVVGAVAPLQAVWNFADITMAGMALINLVAITRLGKWAFAALRDYDENPERPFVATNNPYMPGELPTDIWVRRERALA
ncbi:MULTISPECIES: alanine/glycine:cation symporter family protein [unclassified Actinobaculum]|uniref:alanine/glycine:cation symporter family protein n=1 Tax=unclassified Actinobaculum TaxID=2609299 RepID=UPI000D528294|nr:MULTISPECIES: alanine/glycine:cation symporter family protein [unclassified Actinobaculum]AWE43237.1 sodium:alanine symporter family protein [Actinobaculum sp. 313]RTE49863.1 alanine:cation symporter family protein [Actinobaculum sp. 352]